MTCKNCGEALISKGKYCHNCGQKTETHRLTLKHFLLHDVIHGMFHLDRGLPRTLNQIFMRPGGVAMDYIFGKRKRYYNFFYLLLLIIGLYLFLLSFTEAPKTIDGEIIKGKIIDGNEVNFSNYIEQHRKIIIFCWIPIMTLAASIVFRRLKLSLVEMAIPATIAVIGSSLFNILNTAFVQYFPDNNSSHVLSIFGDITNIFLALSIFLFPMFTFLTFIKGYYSTLGKTWRLLIFYILCLLITFSSLLIFMYVISGGKGRSIIFQ